MTVGEFPRRVAIVMPCLNSASHLIKVINAFLLQELQQKCLIIVDGKSTDESHAIIADFSEKNSEIIWVREADTGISNALNIAMSKIENNDIWGYLGADDILLPGALLNVQKHFQTIPSLNGVYFDSYSQPAGSGPLLRRCPELPFTLPSLISVGTIVGLQNIYLDGALVKRYGFNEAAKYSMDYELYLRLTHDGYIQFVHIPQPSTVNIAEGNISSRYAMHANLEALGFAKKTAGWDLVLIGRYTRHYAGTLLKWLFNLVKR